MTDAAITEEGDGAVKDEGPATSPGPMPPVGAKLCGQGVFTQAESATVCAAPAFVLDIPSPVPRRCSAVSLASGEWQAWCTANTVYLWAKFHTLASSGTFTCGASSSLQISQAWKEFGNSGGTFNVRSTGRLQGSDVALDTTGPLNNDGVKSARLWLSAGVTGCATPPAIVAGVALVWTP